MRLDLDEHEEQTLRDARMIMERIVKLDGSGHRVNFVGLRIGIEAIGSVLGAGKVTSSDTLP